MTAWRDLSDDELVARLVNRGCEFVAAHDLVADRDSPWAADRIVQALGGDR